MLKSEKFVETFFLKIVNFMPVERKNLIILDKKTPPIALNMIRDVLRMDTNRRLFQERLIICY
jgi:hypothetical protein